MKEFFVAELENRRSDETWWKGILFFGSLRADVIVSLTPLVLKLEVRFLGRFRVCLTFNSVKT